MDSNRFRNLNNDISSCLQSLDSHKVTERKTKRQEIQLLLDNDEIIEVLNYNSSQQSESINGNGCLVTWKSVLHCYHRSLILDIEKEDIKRRKSGTDYKQPNLENCSILLRNIINKANKEKPYLSVDDLLSCTLDVSRNNTYQLFMGEVYYKILEQNILSQSCYWHLLSDHWSNLFSLGITLYTADYANMKHVSIKIMKHIVVRGDAHSNVTLTIRKNIFSYLNQAIKDTLQVSNDFSLREDLIILIFETCKTIGVECRILLCKFIEENCTHLINLYENDRLKKVQELFYKLLTFFIKCHHPKCIKFNHKASYVFNERIWIGQLYQIYEFVRREIQQIKNNSNPNFLNYISDLAVNIFNMIYFNELNLNECSTSKRKKIDISLLSFVNGLTKLKPSELCTRLQIITKLLENHSLSFHENDYKNLLQCITICLNSYKDIHSIKNLIICCNALIKSENIINLLIIKSNQVVSFFMMMWTFILKTIVSNDNSDVSHNLLQSLIVLRNWNDEMYSDVLRPYLNKTVKIDNHSLKTLIVLFKTRGFCNVSLNKTNMILLFDWLLPMKIQDEIVWSYSKVNPYLLSEVVDLILTKPSINQLLINQDNLKMKTSNDFTDIFLYSSLQDIPKVQLNITDSKEIKCIKRTVNEHIFQRLINFIDQTLQIERKSSISELKMYLSLTNFLCFLENQYPQLNDKYEFGLYKFKYMEKLKSIVLELGQLNNEEFVTECSLFYKQLQFVDDEIVNNILGHEGNKVIMHKLYYLSKLNDSHVYQVLNYNSLTKEQQLSIKATETLLNTCLYKDHILNHQTSVIKTLLQDLNNLEDSTDHPYTYFKISHFLHVVLNLNNLSLDTLIQINKLIKQLAKKWCYHEESFIQLTLFLKDVLSIITKNKSMNVCTSNLLLIWSLQKISNSKRCGPTMICAFVDLLGHFAYSSNGSFGSMWNINSKMVKPMSPENILLYLKSPFLQVRIAVIKYIRVLCDGYEHNSNIYAINYKEMFDIILHNIHKGLLVDSDISEEEYADEYTNRIATYLLTMQMLIISSNKFRKKALFHIFQTVNDKKINLNLVVNLLEGVAIELNIKSYLILLKDHLNFLLWNWHFNYSNFKEFPIRLFLCTTMEQFIKEYPSVIYPILVIKNDFDLLNSTGIVCKVIEDNFAVIFSYLLAIKITNVTCFNHDEIKDRIENILSEKCFKELIRSQFSDILLKCIKMIEVNIEQPIVQIQINSNQFLDIINIFQETYVKSKIPLLTIMSKRQPNYIQSIVHILFVDIFKKSTSELRYQSFFQYTFFMKVLISQLSECSELDEFTNFLVYQSVRSTITLINENNFETQHYALEYLKWLLTTTQRFLNVNIIQIQPLITSTLRKLAKNQPSFNEILLNLLNILKKLSDQNTNQEISNKDANTLQKDINDFLSQQNDYTDIIQRLQHLKLKLKSNENELQQMYRELLCMRGFSEDCAKSILHRFICVLIQHTKSCDYEVQILAASCLGILGPSDLTTLILQPEPEVLKLELNTSPEYSFIKQIVLMLLNYLSDKNISVMESSNIALFEVITTCEGQSLYEELGKNMLYPFKQSQVEEQDVELSFDIEQFNLLIDIEEIWCPTDSLISYKNWITVLTKQLLTTLHGFCKSLLPIAENKLVFCENILPHLIYFFLVYKPSTRPVLNKYLNCFFNKHYEINKEKNTLEKINTNILQVPDVSEYNIYYDKSAIQCLLNIVSFIRLQQNDPLQNLLDINYLYVSQAAQFCSAHFTSILYLELWCELEFKRMEKDHWSMTYNPIDIITESLPEDGLALQSILNKSYKSIGDSDAIEGCGSKYLLSLSSRTQYYQLLKKWDRVMENCDLQQTTEIITRDYLEAFSNFGLHNVTHIISSNNDNLKYDCCWQLNKWDLPNNGDKTFEALHYHALQYVYQKNLDNAISMINEARLAVIDSLSYASLESTSTIYTPLAKLKIIEDLEDFISTSDKNILFENWLNKKTFKTNDFVNFNKILSQRSKLLDFDGDNRSGILKLNIAEEAKNNDWLQEAGRNLATIISLQNYQKHTTLWAKVEETKLLWRRNDCHMARILLKFVVEELDNYDYPLLHSLALQLYGSWMEETKSETASDIIKKYFIKSINILQMESISKNECGLECKKVLSDACKHLSQYTDTLYQQISKYIKADDLEKRINKVKNDKIKGKALVDLGNLTNNSDRKKAGFFLMQQCNIDESDISNINMKKTSYLKIALQNYLKLMELDDESELPIYRVISLWLENKENNEINDIVDREFNKNSSYKFITILPQLVAHLNCTREHRFHKTLEKLINRCAIEHPYHTIPIIYAVANLNIDQMYDPCKQITNNIEEPRVKAAKYLMSNWKKDKNISSIVVNIEYLYESLIHLAYTKLSCLPGERTDIPDEQPLMKIRNSNIMHPTSLLPLNKHGSYPNIINIESFNKSFLNTGGIHQPKKIDSLCSDGITRSLLLKGNEDMRQDSVMQQVFVLMNRLLQSNNSTSKRKLTIRTYKVIPFSQQSGIAEWCENTMSLSDYLVGKKPNPGAHQKYRPNDIPPSEARNIIRLSQQHKNTQLEQLKKYLSICEKLKPVFRYYFFEKFVSPSIWFERRQSYIHSVATTSMVGYILGLGDRHFQNILIDNNTAELIHIDFGVAFEQGTLLNTPETVPFRLSRDIIDGMGICGIEGTFRKCCEKTMSVLRQNQDVIVTVIEVLLYDPCYQWTLTEEKAAQLQNQSTIENSNITDLTEVNKLAERSLIKIRTKLNGMEEAGSVASINGQVNRLIQLARDPANLSLLYHGWQAYL